MRRAQGSLPAGPDDSRALPSGRLREDTVRSPGDAAHLLSGPLGDTAHCQRCRPRRPLHPGGAAEHVYFAVFAAPLTTEGVTRPSGGTRRALGPRGVRGGVSAPSEAPRPESLGRPAAGACPRPTNTHGAGRRWRRGALPSLPPLASGSGPTVPGSRRSGAGWDPGPCVAQRAPGRPGGAPGHPPSSAEPRCQHGTDARAGASVRHPRPRWPALGAAAGEGRRPLPVAGRGDEGRGRGCGRSLTQAVSGVGRCRVALSRGPSDSCGRHWPSSVGISLSAHVGPRWVWQREFSGRRENGLSFRQVLRRRPWAP